MCTFRVTTEHVTLSAISLESSYRFTQLVLIIEPPREKLYGGLRELLSLVYAAFL